MLKTQVQKLLWRHRESIACTEGAVPTCLNLSGGKYCIPPSLQDEFLEACAGDVNRCQQGPAFCYAQVGHRKS
jgi:hypothetical protein